MSRRIAVVGAGISGLATAHYLVRELSAAGESAELLVFEADRSPGGKMRTFVQDGFRLEWGPNGFLTNKPYTTDLVKDLSAERHLLRSSDLARKRFVYSDGALHRLPESPPMFLRSGLLTLRGKARILAEPFGAPPPPEGTDETVADFARRRLGQEALDKLLDPMVTGIFCGDPEKMSLASCFPVIRDLERKHGGLFKGMLAVARERKAAGRKAEVSAGPGGVLTSFDEGVETLVSVLAERLRPALQYGVTVDRIERGKGGGYTLLVTDKGKADRVDADDVVLAVPAYAAKEIVSTLDGELSSALGAIPYAPVAVVALGFQQATLENPLDGFGFLTTKASRRRVLGVLWDSSVFSNRAPLGKALIRAMVGGVRSPELASLPAEDLVTLVRDEIAATMGVRAVPLLSRAFHHPLGIPQYNVGHGRLLARMDGRLASLPGITLNSNAYRGVSLNDCVRESLAAARRVVRGPAGGAP